ncbi:MAG: ral nucleoside transport system permease protein [Thermotogaceae bacterium]|nr:ral nucleoside transport system permease protein [Thermotogaceae bacterium]
MKSILSIRGVRVLTIILLSLSVAYLLTVFSHIDFKTDSFFDGLSSAFGRTNDAFFLFLTSPLIRVLSGEIHFNMMSFSQWLNQTTPLIFTGLAISLVFNIGVLNLGAEGQMFAGAVAGSCIAVFTPLPDLIHILLIFLVSAITGALWSVLPAYASYKKRNSEILVSLMMNYLAFYLGIYVIKRFIRDETSGALMSIKFAPSSAFPLINERYKLHVGFIFAILLALIVWYLLKKTRWGLKIKMIGSNPQFAEYSGIHNKRALINVQLISGAIAGTAGIFELIGFHGRFLWSSSPGYGWDGIIVAIMASKNPIYVPLSAAFLAYIRVGAQNMGRYTDVSPDLVKIIQAIIIIFLTTEGLFTSESFHPSFRKLRGHFHG